MSNWILNALPPADPPLTFPVPARCVVDRIGYAVNTNRHAILLTPGARARMELPVLAAVCMKIVRQAVRAKLPGKTRLSHLLDWLTGQPWRRVDGLIVSPVQIAGIYVDGCKLHGALREAPDGEVAFGWNEKMLVLRGDDWTCGLMMLWWSEAAPIYVPK